MLKKRIFSLVKIRMRSSCFGILVVKTFKEKKRYSQLYIINETCKEELCF